MHRSTLRAALVLAAGTLAPVTLCHAQVASALLRELDQILPGGPSVSSLNNTAVNSIGGYAATVNTSDGLSNIWGNLSGGPGAIIRSEGDFDGILQTSYETFFGVGDSTTTYSPLGTGGGFTGLDCVFRDDQRIMAERDPHPSLSGQFWSFGSRPSITAAGQVWFVGGITATAGGTTQNRGLFTGGDSDSVVLLGGQMVPGLSNPLNTGTAVDFDFRVSQDGLHYIAPVVLTGATATDSAIVLDGSAAMAGGSILREGTLVPMSVGGNGVELYAAFDFMGVTNSGQWMVTGDTNAATTADEFVMLDGVMVLRDGASVSGQTIQGDIEGGYLNNDGDYAVVWDVAANTREVLIVNGAIVLSEGDTVDWDGDGVAKDNAVLTDFTGITSLTLSNRAAGVVNAYFTADINVNGTVLEGYFRLPVAVGPSILPGDTNCDGEVNDADCEPFVLALTDPSAYEASFPDCNILSADVNLDGAVNLFDVAPFCKVSGAICDICAVPGDTNCDGTVNDADCEPFVLALIDAKAYAKAFPNCNILSADMNEDGVVDTNDIAPFCKASDAVCSLCTLPGDTNCDGSVNDADCEPMILALTDPNAYAEAFPDCNILTADVNEDGVVDLNDVDPFCKLSGASCRLCCPCNWNGDNALNSQDFFDFLTDFFDNNADFNRDLVTNSQDFFDFLTCFFDGCL